MYPTHDPTSILTFFILNFIYELIYSFICLFRNLIILVSSLPPSPQWGAACAQQESSGI